MDRQTSTATADYSAAPRPAAGAAGARGLDFTAAQLEATRCVQCPTAPCRQACPVHTDIPAALDRLAVGDVLGAAAGFRATNPLPDICGRVCPHEQLCEGACAGAARAIPIQIGRLEVFATDVARRVQHPPVRTRRPATGRRVAIIGAGPAGLSVAEELAVRGHAAVVYDAWPAPGGILHAGIPTFKLPRHLLADKIAALRTLGVVFVGNTVVGRDITFAAVQAAFDAVFLGTGAAIANRLGIDGEDLPGVCGATAFLARAKLPAAQVPAVLWAPLVDDRRVVVIGAGDTALACALTALRLGAAEVTCLSRSSAAAMRGRAVGCRMAEAEGVRFRYRLTPRRLLAGTDGRLRALVCQPLGVGEPDASGRRPMPVAGPAVEVPCDVAVVAIGYRADPRWQEVAGLATAGAGYIQVDPATGQTSLPGVFAGGDGVHGPSQVIAAIAAGRRAAAGIDAYLLNAR